MADGLYDYLPLSILFVFRENKEKFCTQQEVDALAKIDNVRNLGIFADGISKSENIEYIVLTSLERGIMINDIAYSNYHKNEWIGGYIIF